MKTKELIRRLNDHGFDVSKVFENNEIAFVDVNDDGFSIVVPVDATNWLEIHTLVGSGLNTKQSDIASALVTEYLNTPVDERVSQKYYLLVTERGDFGEQYVDSITRESDNQVVFSFTYAPSNATSLSVEDIKHLKEDEPWLATAIDAMKEEVHDDDEK